MVKMNLSEINVPERIAEMWAPLNAEQREFLANNFTLQNYKKNETIYCEGESPTYLMCLLSGKVKIYKDGVGGRSQIIRMIKPTEYLLSAPADLHESFHNRNIFLKPHNPSSFHIPTARPVYLTNSLLPIIVTLSYVIIQ